MGAVLPDYAAIGDAWGLSEFGVETMDAEDDVYIVSRMAANPDAYVLIGPSCTFLVYLNSYQSAVDWAKNKYGATTIVDATDRRVANSINIDCEALLEGKHSKTMPEGHDDMNIGEDGTIGGDTSTTETGTRDVGAGNSGDGGLGDEGSEPSEEAQLDGLTAKQKVMIGGGVGLVLLLALAKGGKSD